MGYRLGMVERSGSYRAYEGKHGCGIMGRLSLIVGRDICTGKA